MRKKRLLLWLIIVLVACFIVWKVAERTTQHVLAQTDLDVRPYVSEQVHYLVVNGAEQVVVRETVARTRSGAKVHAGTIYSPDGKHDMKGMRRIDLPDGFVGMMIDSLGIKSTGRRADQNLAEWKAEMAHRNQSKDCANQGGQIEGEEVLGGQRALREVRLTADGLGRIVLWLLPDYDCEAVQGVIQKRASTDAPWEATAGSHLAKFVEIDPDPALFSGFAHYSEMPPTQLVKKAAEEQGVVLPSLKDCPKCKDIDQTYRDLNK